VSVILPVVSGGDEFAVIFPKTTLEDARMICERILERLKKEKLQQISVSIGVAAAGKEYYPVVNDFIREADRNMYNSKMQSTKLKDSHNN
jgi:diguanylate cyclase (GGDEF)-like protein